MANPPIWRTIRCYTYVRLPKGQLAGGKGRIIIDPDIHFGAPCIKGTRIPASTLASMVAGGDSIDYLATSFEISPEDVQAAVDYIEGK